MIGTVHGGALAYCACSARRRSAGVRPRSPPGVVAGEVLGLIDRQLRFQRRACVPGACSSRVRCAESSDPVRSASCMLTADESGMRPALRRLNSASLLRCPGSACQPIRLLREESGRLGDALLARLDVLVQVKRHQLVHDLLRRSGCGESYEILKAMVALTRRPLLRSEMSALTVVSLMSLRIRSRISSWSRADDTSRTSRTCRRAAAAPRASSPAG